MGVIAKDPRYIHIEEAPPVRWLFMSKAAAPIWLVVRMYLGFEWTKSGFGKIWGTGNQAWMHGGSALKGFAAGAIKAAQAPEHPDVAYGWYVAFLRWVESNAGWFSKVVAVGEFTIGLALMLGLLTGMAAFMGLVLNFSFVFAGSAGVNPLFIILGMLLLLAWRNAGYNGLDYFALPALGTPWRPGQVFEEPRDIHWEGALTEGPERAKPSTAPPMPVRTEDGGKRVPKAG